MISKVTVRAAGDMATGIRPTEIEIDLQVDVDVCEGFRDDIRMALDDCLRWRWMIVLVSSWTRK